MKAITVKQPWASLIVEGIKINEDVLFKNIENRTWKTNVRGRVLIHASAKPWSWNMFAKYLLDKTPIVYKLFPQIRQYAIDKLTLGAIIGSAEIVDCVINDSSIWAEKTEVITDKEGFPAYGGKIYNWVLANPVKFDNPIPCKGKLSFWEYNGGLPQ